MFDVNIQGVVCREYSLDSDDFLKAKILRFNVLALGGVNDTAVKFIYGDHGDEKSHHLLGAFYEDSIVGTLNLAPDAGLGDDCLMLRQFAVDARLQGKGIGKLLITFAHEFAREKGYKAIYMHARTNALHFYSRCGYALTGKVFDYPTITLYEMYREL